MIARKIQLASGNKQINREPIYKTNMAPDDHKQKPRINQSTGK
jgi:hypothetical protein